LLGELGGDFLFATLEVFFDEPSKVLAHSDVLLANSFQNPRNLALFKIDGD